jgi:DNA polymerase III epsilon subunit family exonuclease
MSGQLGYTMFQRVFFPDRSGEDLTVTSDNLLLQRVVRFSPKPQQRVSDLPLVVFDFETTGLDSKQDRIIEIGAIRINPDGTTSEYSTLIDPGFEISDNITKITGITMDELRGAPALDERLPEFLEFIDGGLLVAHNAEFDMSFLNTACARYGYQLHWPCICTLKMARILMAELPSKSLDTLAQTFDLRFESRHRSIGDVKVTAEVLKRFLTMEKVPMKVLSDFQNFSVIP